LSDLCQSIEYTNDEIYLGLSHLCIGDNQSLNFCGSLLRLDSNGNKIDSIVEYGFNVGNENIIEFMNDSIYFLGYDTKFGSINRKEIEVLSTTLDFENFERRTINLDSFVNEFFLNGTQNVNGENWLYGNGNGEGNDSTGVQGLIFKMDSSYNEITDLIRIEQCTLENHVFDARLLDMEYLVFVNHTFFESVLDRKVIVNKLSTEGELIGSYNSSIVDVNSIDPNLGLLENQDIVFSIAGDPFKREKIVTCIDGEFLVDKWSTSIPSTNSSDFWWIEINSILPLSNSDFIVVGQKRYNTSTGKSHGGYVIRISAAGDILWEKTVISKIHGEFRNGEFLNAIELPSGEIVIAGQISTGVIDNVSTSDLWVVKMDEDGCIGIDDCGQNTYTSTSSIAKSSDVRLSPNPVVNVLDINSNETIFNGFSIFDLTGNLRQNSTFSGTSKYKVDTSDLAPGIYFLAIKDSYGHTISMEKFVKQE